MRRWWLMVLGWGAIVSGGCAEAIDDLVRIHRESIGGVLFDEWPGMEALGVVKSGEAELRFEMIAARPNRVRLTLHAAGRTLVQATDGVSPPWQADSRKMPMTSLMSAGDGQAFLADAEFEDPLMAGARRGFTLDYAGETEWDGRKMLKVLVTRADSPPSFLLVDPDTYFVAARLTKRHLPSGREVTEETRYDDFRAVAGVIFPHRITVTVDGRKTQETILADIRRVGEPPEEVFPRPFISGGTAEALAH